MTDDLSRVTYTPDGNFLVFRPYSGEDVQVPVKLIDEIIERGIQRSIPVMASFRNLTVGRDYEWVAMEELVGVDLSDKTVYIWFSNWEDSEWMSTTEAVTVISEGDNSYRFKFNEKLEAAWNGTADEDEEIERFEPLQGISFHGREKVMILTER